MKKKNTWLQMEKEEMLFGQSKEHKSREKKGRYQLFMLIKFTQGRKS